MKVALVHGDCFDRLPMLDEHSIDAVVTDPPYGLEFMGKDWDKLGLPDGFRRQRNPADAGRDDVFGRTTRTSPEYAAGVEMQRWHERWAREVLRVLKPGGYLLAFGGTRTHHRLACAIEDAGFEMRDAISGEGCVLRWYYGQGMVKNLDIGRVVDMDHCTLPDGHCMSRLPEKPSPADHLCPRTAEGDAWRWAGTALRPAWEPILVARKPPDGNMATNVQTWGTGALDIAASRVRHVSEADRAQATPQGAATSKRGHVGAEPDAGAGEEREAFPRPDTTLGRFPPNLILTHAPGCQRLGDKRVPGIVERVVQRGPRPSSEAFRYSPLDNARTGGYADVDGMETVPDWRCVNGCPVAELDRQSGPAGASAPASGPSLREMNTSVARGRYLGLPEGVAPAFHNDDGGAARFFPQFHYCSKASRSEREEGCAHLPPRHAQDTTNREPDAPGNQNPRSGAGRGAGATRFRCGLCGVVCGPSERRGIESEPCAESEDGLHLPIPSGKGKAIRNHHPTVKPLDLMRWLVRLVARPGMTVLDPFAGSGTTGVACALEGVDFLGIEREKDYYDIATARIDAAAPLFTRRA